MHYVDRLVNVLAVSRSGYFAWKKRQGQTSSRTEAQRICDEKVKSIFLANKSRYGAPRIHEDLKDQGIFYNRKTVSASLKRQELQAKARRKYKATTNSQHGLSVAENLLNREFTATQPNQKYVGDITHLETGEGWLYLAVWIDLYSRAVVGWSMSERMTATLVCDAFNMALDRRGQPKTILVRSDRGSQYCSTDFRQLLNKNRCIQSMGRKGNCYDNSCSESFFHSLKVEAIHGECFTTREEMHSAVFNYIEVDYNLTRRHSSNGYISPMQFEQRNAA